MTLHRLPSSSGILARKGGAAPLGLSKPSAEEARETAAEIEPGTKDAAGEPVQLALVSDFEATAPASPANEPPPPASLLPFALHRGRLEQDDAWELVSPKLLHEIAATAREAHREPAPEKPLLEPAPEAAKAADRPESRSEAPEPASPGATSPDSPPGSPPEPAPATAAAGGPEGEIDSPTQASPGRAPETERPAPRLAPAADPAWRIGVDSLPAAPPAVPMRWLGLAAAVGVLIAGIGWWSFEAETPAPREPRQASEPVVPDAAPGGADGSETAGAEAGTPADTAPVTAPSVDLVRIETNGDAVIAGRAAPNSELILLDNGAPVGTVKADAFGEWVFVPETPLPPGPHEFGLVLKSVQGTVVVPAAPQPPPAPAAGEGQQSSNEAGPDSAAEIDSGAARQAGTAGIAAQIPARKPLVKPSDTGSLAPVPARKPDLGGQESSSSVPPSTDFVAQLASVKTPEGARREWRKLKLRFPEALSGMALSLHETKLSSQGAVVRVRTGPFPGLSEAADFCARIRAGRRDCLVVRTGSAD